MPFFKISDYAEIFRSIVKVLLLAVLFIVKLYAHINIFTIPHYILYSKHSHLSEQRECLSLQIHE